MFLKTIKMCAPSISGVDEPPGILGCAEGLEEDREAQEEFGLP